MAAQWGLGVMAAEGASTTSEPRGARPRFEGPENTANLMEALFLWTDGLVMDEEFSKFRGRRMSATLYFDEPGPPIYSDDDLTYNFPPEIEEQHALVIMCFNLWEAKEMMKQCKYYFRRYPFRGLPVSKDEHFRNICEMYFSWFYIIRSRCKNILNKLGSISGIKFNVGRFLKAYDAEFDQELRMRNQVHHSAPFDDLTLDRLKLTRLMSLGGPRSSGWVDEHRTAYRAATKEWAARVDRRATAIEVYIDVIAKVVLDHATFLAEPVKLPPRSQSAS